MPAARVGRAFAAGGMAISSIAKRKPLSRSTRRLRVLVGFSKCQRVRQEGGWFFSRTHQMSFLPADAGAKSISTNRREIIEVIALPPTVHRLVRWGQMATAALPLMACGSGSAPATSQPASMPQHVVEMTNRPRSAGSSLDEQSRGRFDIRPDTLFCQHAGRLAPELSSLAITPVGLDGVELAQSLAKLGQSDTRERMPRLLPVTEPVCSGSGNVEVSLSIEPNKNGRPYKIVLAAWQGNAAWVGRAERDGDYEQFADAKWMGEPERATRSISSDNSRLTRAFGDHISGGGSSK